MSVPVVIITYRPPDLGGYVSPPKFSLWTPPPTLSAWQDPYLMQRTITALRHLGGQYSTPPRQSAPRSRMYGSPRGESAPEAPSPTTASRARGTARPTGGLAQRRRSP